MKKIIVIYIFLFSLLSVFGEAEFDGKKYFTDKDLEKYNRESKAGYFIAVDGVVYDVSKVPAWKSGSHKSGSAGEDISGKITSAPHGKKVLERLPVSGYLVKGFTLKDLEAYNGKNGMPKYIAVDGVVFDVGDTAAWNSGMHKGGAAGEDISDKIVKAPHGKGVLQKRKVAGIITSAVK